MTGPASTWITERFQTHDPDELAEYFARHNATVMRKVMPLGPRTDFRISRNEMDLGRVRLAQTKSTSLRFYVETLPSSRLSVTLSEQGQSLISDGKS